MNKLCWVRIFDLIDSGQNWVGLYGLLFLFPILFSCDLFNGPNPISSGLYLPWQALKSNMLHTSLQLGALLLPKKVINNIFSLIWFGVFSFGQLSGFLYLTHSPREGSRRPILFINIRKREVCCCLLFVIYFG